MELLVLGACGSWPAPGRATSGYLLTHDGFNLWIDLGTGTLARLQEHITHVAVDAALISQRTPITALCPETRHCRAPSRWL